MAVARSCTEMNQASTDLDRDTTDRLRVGLIGLGRMGLPIARRLAAVGHDLMVWNRSATSLAQACAAGACAAATPAELVARVDTIVLMLANGDAVDAVLGRRGSALTVDVAGKIILQLGTTSPNYSQALGNAVTASGGRYVEAPVSGSSVPAEQGTLIGMIGASSPGDFTAAEQVMACLASRTFRVGSPPAAMKLKLAVNAFLIPLVSALGQAWRMSDALGLDPVLFGQMLDTSPMASDVSRMKLDKLIRRDFSAQASVDDVAMNAHLILELAAQSNCSMDLVAAAAGLLENARKSGHGSSDMIVLGQTAR